MALVAFLALLGQNIQENDFCGRNAHLSVVFGIWKSNAD